MIEKYAANFINFMFRNYIYIEINVRNLDNPRSAVVRRISKDQLVVDNYVRGKIAHFIQTDDEGFALQLAAEWIETGYNPEGTKEMDDPTRTGVCEVCHDKSLLKADELIVENQRLTQELEEERRWIPFELIEPNTGD
ncbi:MAG: hypothetical protein LLG42_11945, partial [Chloroflexi bacterium]|nr:hypothetical protein [Chloroflexota bacterium]